MAQKSINIGSTANDGTGETVRSAFDKTNDNFTELYADNSVTHARLENRYTASGSITCLLYTSPSPRD